jgi:predicted Zn-dependent protease with MMP-like domain
MHTSRAEALSRSVPFLGATMTDNIPTERKSVAPSFELIEEVLRDTIKALPASYKVMASAVGINLMDFAPEELLAEIGVDDPFAFAGLYTGIPLTEKSENDPADITDTIWLFRRPLIDEWAMSDGVTFEQVVTHVTLGELAHHFGWTPEELVKLDSGWDWDNDTSLASGDFPDA